MIATRPSRACHDRRGLSLLELVLVMAILAVLAAIAAPRYGRAEARYRATLAARRIAADLALAGKSARTAGARRTVTFSVAAGEYSISGLGGLDDPSADYRVALSARPYEARIVSADFGGDAQLVFSGYGVPDSGGTVTVQVGQIARTVVFDAASGRATVP